MMRHHIALVTTVLGFAIAGAANAQGHGEAEDFCLRLGRNQTIFDMALESHTAEPLAAPGAIRCTWSFSAVNGAELRVVIESTLLGSEAAARQTILLARLPENHRGKEILPARAGDDAVYRTTVEAGETRLIEIEAVKGRRHFLMTLQPASGAGIDYTRARASVSFLASGLAAL